MREKGYSFVKASIKLLVDDYIERHKEKVDKPAPKAGGKPGQKPFRGSYNFKDENEEQQEIPIRNKSGAERNIQKKQEVDEEAPVENIVPQKNGQRNRKIEVQEEEEAIED